MKISYSVLILTFLASICIAQSPADQIKNLEKQWLIESYKTGDMANYDRIVADDFRITHSNGKVINKTEKRADIIKNQIKEPKPDDIFAINDSSVRISVHGDTAVSKGFIIENYMWKGNRYLDHVHYTNTYVKRNGNWQVISCHLTRLNQKSPPKSREVTFNSKDGIKLYADIYESKKGKSAPLIMLFHQGGGDVRGEYAPIIPKLLKQGYNVMATDVRQGGSRFGTNRTMANIKQEFGYCDAYPDLEAALDFAKAQGFSGKKIAWGSSFTAALVFQLASKRGNDLAGILGFSPASGGPMTACKPSLYAKDVKIPALGIRPRREMRTGIIQFTEFKKHGIQTYVAENGVHGSSMLVEARVKGDVEAHWKKVLAFIADSVR